MLYYIKYVLRILVICLLILQAVVTRCRLPNGCELVKSNTTDVNALFYCSEINVKFEMGFRLKQMNECTPILKKHSTFLKIYFKADKPTVLDESFDYEGMYRTYVDNSYEKRLGFYFEIVLGQFKGFDLSSYNFRSNRTKKKRVNRIATQLIVYIYDSPLEFYSRNRLAESCEDYLNGLVANGYGENLFQACSFPCSFRLRRVDFSRPICPLAFNNSYIKQLFIYRLIQTFYKSNYMRFLDSHNYSLDCTIEYLNLIDEDNIDIGKRLINLDIFKNTLEFESNGMINKIEVDLFLPANFPKLNMLSFALQFFVLLIRRHGIDWIMNINKGLNFNLSVNLTLNESSQLKKIRLMSRSGSNVLEVFENDDVNFYFPDEDFCLYSQFPFHQLVFITFNNPIRLHTFSCTLTWLIQHNSMIFPHDYNVKVIKRAIKKCNFKISLSKCNKSDYTHAREYSIFDVKAAMIVWRFVFIILLPIICLAGVTGNILILIITTHKKNKKTLKEKQYVYMTLKSATNCLILFIETFSLMNDCQSRNGIYCSSIRKSIFIQYFKIIFSEFLCNYLRFASNLFHIAFSLNRLSLIGKEHSKFTEFMSQLRIRNYIIFVFIVSFFVTFVKGFRLRANFYDVDSEYPFVYIIVDQKIGLYGLKMAISILNCLCDFLNGLVFLMFSIVIDIQLLLALKRTTAEKLKKLENISKANVEKQKDSLKDSVFRAIIMVVLNSLANLLLKTPSTIVSIVEFAEFIVYYYSDALDEDVTNFIFDGKSLVFFKYELLESRQAFEVFAKCLFMISIGSDILFYYKFDKSFKEAFHNTFSSLDKTIS